MALSRAKVLSDRDDLHADRCKVGERLFDFTDCLAQSHHQTRLSRETGLGTTRQYRQ